MRSVIVGLWYTTLYSGYTLWCYNLSLVGAAAGRFKTRFRSRLPLSPVAAAPLVAATAVAPEEAAAALLRIHTASAPAPDSSKADAGRFSTFGAAPGTLGMGRSAGSGAHHRGWPDLRSRCLLHQPNPKLADPEPAVHRHAPQVGIDTI